MKWLGIVAGVVLAGIVGAAVLLPRLIDWQSYRPEIAAFAEAAIGLPVAIDGNIRAELFPTPQLTAAGIRVLGRDGGEDLAAIRWAEARFKFSDLLRGSVTLTSLALVEPTFALSSDLLGQLQVGPGAAGEGRSDGVSPGDPVSGTLGGTQRREAKRIEIRNGTFKLGGADNPQLLIERVSGTVENAAVGSRVTVSLAGRARGRDLELEMRVAPPQQTVPAPIAFTVTDKANASTLRVVGEWSMKEGDVGLNGAFSLNGGDLGSIAALTRLTLPSGYVAGGDFRVDGNFALDGAVSALQVTDLSANTDVLSVTGEAFADWSGRPKLDIALRAGRLDLDGFVARRGDAPGENASGEAAGVNAAVNAGADASPGSSTVAEAPDLMTWIGTLPADVSLDLSVAGARFRDTIVRRIAVRGSVDRGTVTLEELSAQLPGGTDLSIAGFGDMTGSEPLLEGNATLRADDLRRLLNWAGLPVPNVSADRLRRFSMVSGISLRPRRLDIIDAAVELDGVTASAAAAVALRRRPGLGLRVSIDHINLDAYRSVYAAPAADRAAPAAGDQAAGQAAGQAGDPATLGAVDAVTLWSRFDASLDLAVGRAVALDIPFNDVVGDLVLKDGVLTVNEVTFRDAGGVSGQFGGQVSVAGDADSTFFAFEGQSDDIGQIVALLEGPDVVAGLLRSIGPSALNISYRPASGDAPLVFQAQGEDGALSIGAALSIGETGEPAVDILSGELNAHGTALSGLAGRMTFPEGAYQLEKLSGTLNGGTLNLSGSLRRREDGLQQLLMTGALDGMQVDRELADLDGPLGLTGTISIRGQAESTGSDWRAMAALNSGWFDMEGSLAIDVGPSRTSIVKVRQVSDVRDALREHFSKPGSIAGALVLENGVLIARDLALRGKTGGQLGLSGRLDMTDLDLSAELVLRKAGNAPQFARLIAEGPAKAPNLRLEGAGPAEN